jgi:hypothetical protein
LGKTANFSSSTKIFSAVVPPALLPTRFVEPIQKQTKLLPAGKQIFSLSDKRSSYHYEKALNLRLMVLYLEKQYMIPVQNLICFFRSN